MVKFLFLILSFLTLEAHAHDIVNDLKKIILPNNRTIIITGHPDYPPVIWSSSNKKHLQGISVELMEKIFSEINVKVIFKNVETWGRAQEEVKNGRIDMLLPPYKTKERLVFYNYSATHFMMDETAVFVKKGKQFNFSKFSDLSLYKGTAIINDSFGSEFDKFDSKNSNLTRLATTDQCFRFVDKDRARFVIAGASAGLAALAKLNMEDKFVMLPKRIISTGMYAPLSNKSPWNTPLINEYLKKKFHQYITDGTIARLEKKYIALIKNETLSL